MVKAIFLDIDGTLRDERMGVPESAVKAIRMCRERGVPVVICTGRNLASIQPDVRAIGTDAVIAGGGCLIQDNSGIRKNFFFQYEEIKDMIGCLTKGQLPFAMESQDRIFMNQAAGTWFRQDFERKLKGLGHAKTERMREENRICYRDTMGEYKKERDHIHKVCIWIPPDDPFRLVSMAEAAGSVAQQGERDGWWYLEVLPQGCTKGAAIREWCGFEKIDPRDTMSFGDGKNDIDMLLATGIGVAMADGDEELKACATYICGTAMEDGIYRELVKRRIIETGYEEET